MKLLSIVVPCYNSEAYMRKCVDSLLLGGERVEVIIVDDGSKKDNTSAIADEYAAKYPTIVKTIHQENKGHGGALNTGILNATGKYLKVVDSDDYLAKGAYLKVLKKLDDLTQKGLEIDMFACNFVYDKAGARHKKTMSYKGCFPENRIFGWDEIRGLHMWKYLLMHSVIFRTQVLWESSLRLPEHTFYVDNLFVFVPLPYVRKMYYMDVDLYMYFIGRDDQSVNRDIMIQRVDQQVLVNKEMLAAYNPEGIANENLQHYQKVHLCLITIVTCLLLTKTGREDHLRQRDEFWKFVKKEYPEKYSDIRNNIAIWAIHLPKFFGRHFSIVLYEVANALYGFS